MLLRLISFLIVFTWLPLCIVASNAHEDSLLRVLKTLPQDTQRVLTYNELFKATFTSEPLKALDYAQTALKLSRDLGYLRGISRLCNNLGVWHSKRGNYTESIGYYRQARQAFTDLHDAMGIADADMNIGSVHYKLGDYAAATAQYKDALRQYHVLGDTARVLTAVSNLGSVCKEQGQYPEALQAFMAALDLRERQGDYVELGVSYGNVGSIYQLQGMRKPAKRFFLQSLHYAELGNDQFGKVAALTSLSEIAMEEHGLAAAHDMLMQALTIAREIDDQFGLSSALLSLAQLHQLREMPDSAMMCYKEALMINRTIGRIQGVGLALNHLGALQLAQGDLTNARLSLTESLLISDSLQTPELSLDNHALLAKLCARIHDFERAFYHETMRSELHDSLYTTANARLISEMDARYKAKQHLAQIDQLSLQATKDQLRIATASTRFLFVVGALVVVVLIILIIFLRYILKRRHNRRIAEKNAEIHQQRDLLEAQNRQIKEINVSLERIVEQRTQAMRNANQELDTFLYESAHALRRPLLRIQGLEDIIETEEDPMLRMRLRGQLRVTIAGMDELLHKLIYVSESGNREVKLEPIPLMDMVREIGSQQPMSEILECHFPDDLVLMSDTFMLKILLTMVLENAFRFLDLGRHDQRVAVQVVTDAAATRITVEDSGTGISPENISKVCEMFFRGPNHRGGNGLGLYIASKMVGKLNGEISFESPAGKGTTVTILLPHHSI